MQKVLIHVEADTGEKANLLIEGATSAPEFNWEVKREVSRWLAERELTTHNLIRCDRGRTVH